MGTSFANIQVRTEKEPLEFVKILEAISSINFEGYYIGKTSLGWITILADHYNWESIAKEGEQLSEAIENIVLAIGYFDDEIFKLCMLKKGELITEQVSGQALEVYGMEESHANAELLVKKLDINKSPMELELLLKDNNLEEAVGRLEEYLEIPLRIKYDWYDVNDEFWHKFIVVNQKNT